jgi:threonine/homoserine/homoserine lactone efflux protein
MNKEDSNWKSEIPHFISELPFFVKIKKALKKLSWLPFIFTFLSMLVLVVFFQILFFGLTKYDQPLTYGGLMILIISSLIAAVLIGFLVKLAAEMKIKAKLREKGLA